MRPATRRIAGIIGAFALGLHIALWGVLAAPTVVGATDPFSIICHSDASTDNPASQAPAGTPGHACDHCNLCGNVAVPPAPAGTPAALVQSVLLLRPLTPLNASPRSEVPVESTSARGPPVLA